MTRPSPTILRAIGACAVAATALVGAGCTASPAPSASASAGAVPPEIQAIMDDPTYAGGRWGLSVIDVATGEVLVAENVDERFLTGSTAKIFSVTAALGEIDPDERFRTPVYAVGSVSGDTLTGDLVLQASGDLTLGGRTLPDGTIDVPIFDHYDANALPGIATLTPEDPLAGLDDLAAQIAASGIRRVAGDVVIDDRLWETAILDKVPISPITINDNLIDFTVTPGVEGAPATMDWRPRSAVYSPTISVTTGAPDSAIDLDVTDGGAGHLTVVGSVPAGSEPVVHTFQVPDPARWARSLFIEALGRAGVQVDADALSGNPSSALPSRDDLAGMTAVAAFTSPPFSETIRLINKVSHNLGANQLPLLLAARSGADPATLEVGISIVRAALARGGLTADAVTIADGQGLPGNTVTPAGMTTYLRFLTGTPTFSVFDESTPVLGVDGSLAHVLPAGDPAIGHARAKTGTLVGAGTTTPYILQTKALAGYIDAKSGRELAFALFVNDVPMTEVAGVLQANSDLGAIASALYSAY